MVVVKVVAMAAKVEEEMEERERKEDEGGIGFGRKFCGVFWFLNG